MRRAGWVDAGPVRKPARTRCGTIGGGYKPIQPAAQWHLSKKRNRPAASASHRLRKASSTCLPPIRIRAVLHQFSVVIDVIAPPRRSSLTQLDLRLVHCVASRSQRVVIAGCLGRLHVSPSFHQFADVALAFQLTQVRIGTSPQSLLVNKVSTVGCYWILHSDTTHALATTAAPHWSHRQSELVVSLTPKCSRSNSQRHFDDSANSTISRNAT